MFDDLILGISLIAGFVLFFYAMAKLNKNGAMEAAGMHGAIIVFAITMTIALSPILFYEHVKKTDFNFNSLIANTVELYNFMKDK